MALCSGPDFNQAPATNNGMLNISPGGADGTSPGYGFQWFFGTPDSSINVPPGGCQLFADPQAGPGGTEGEWIGAVSSLHKILRFWNTGTDPLTIDLAILGSTTGKVNRESKM